MMFLGTGVISVISGSTLGIAFVRGATIDASSPVPLEAPAPSAPREAPAPSDHVSQVPDRTWTEPSRVIGNPLIARELEAERAAEELDRRAPVPVAPREEGLLGRITDARIAGEDRDAFYLAIDANRRAESGAGGARFSTLRTTAGPEHRASYGVAQLTIRAHLVQLARLDDGELAELRIDRDEIVRMQRAGDAAIAWYRLIVEGRAAEAVALRVDPASAAALRSCSGDRRALIARGGARFVATTGLPAAALRELGETCVLRERALREAFAARYRAMHGVAFDPANRDGARMRATVLALARERRDLAALLARLGGETAAVSLAHYLGVGDVAENLYGWHARAAAGAVGPDRFVSLLASADPISTRLTELSSFEAALAAVRGTRDVEGLERARMLTRIARCFHGAPSRAREAFFWDGDLARPRATTAAELEAGIQEHRAGRMWSDDRVQRAFDDLARQRSLR